MSNKPQWQGNTGGGWLGQLMLVKILGRCNLRMVYCMAAVVAAFYMLFARKHYLAVYHYFRRHFGCSAWQAFVRTYRNHYIFGQIILDRFAVFSVGYSNFIGEKVGYEHYQRLCDGKKGFIIVSSHVGNFELAGYSFKAEKKPITMLYYQGETKIVQHNRSRMLNRNNIHFVPVLPDMSHLFAVNAALQKGEIVSMFADRVVGSAKCTACDFLNGKADFPVGAFALAASFEVEVLAVFCMKIAARRYKTYIQPLGAAMPVHADKQQKITMLAQAYATALENVVRAYPEQWFNYYEFWKN